MNRRVMVMGAAMALIGSAMFVNVAAAMDDATVPHPAHVHTGICPDVGEVVEALGDVSHEFLVDGTPTMSAAMGPATGIPVELSVTNVPLSYGDIFAAPHSIVVHRSLPEIAVYILCGDIGGPEMGPADIAIGLGPLNESGYNGIATLHDNGDGTTRVSVFMTQEVHAMMPEATTAP